MRAIFLSRDRLKLTIASGVGCRITRQRFLSKYVLASGDNRTFPSKFAGLGGKRILSIGRLAIVLDLGGAGLAQVDDRLTREMVGRDLGALIHRFPPSSIWPRACGR